MSTAATPPRTPGRRPLAFAAPAAVLADVDRLRRGGYRSLGQWTLPQVCYHLAEVITGNLAPPLNGDEPTAEEAALKDKFFASVLSPDGYPEGRPLPAQMLPPATAGDCDIDALAAAFAALAAYPHAKIQVGRCGPVPVAEVRQLHLAHAAHHLSFLLPTTARRALRYGSLADVADDVRTLRHGYVRAGQWTLPQTCWHLHAVMRRLALAPMADPTPEQLARRSIFDRVLAGGSLPAGLPAPDELLPPPTAGDADVDAFLALLQDRQGRPPAPAMHRLFGPLTADEAAQLSLLHCANHLSYLVPTA